MNDINSYTLPQATTTIEVNDPTSSLTNNTLPMQISQSQNLIPPPSIVTYQISTRPFPETTLLPSTEISKPKLPPSVVEVHHLSSKNYLLEPYCRPILDITASSKEDTCKFGRTCIVNKSKIFSYGEHLSHISSTVFKSNRKSSKKFHYDMMDTRLVTCFNKSCKSTNTKFPKTFHYICFQHMMTASSNHDMQFIEIEKEDDNILKQITEEVNMKKVMDVLKHKQTKLLFPVCGKRCYNTVIHLRNKKDPKKDSDYAAAKSWESDGNVIKGLRSSIEILIGWLTTEENASKYFGGIDKNGRTSATRKEAYHYHIRDVIKSENGSERSSESIRSKIVRVLSSYKMANERMNNTGSGLEGIEFANFQDYIVNDVCKYYFLLDPILKDRPNVTPWYTNEDSDSDIEEENQPDVNITSILSSSDDEVEDSSLNGSITDDDKDSEKELVGGSTSTTNDDEELNVVVEYDNQSFNTCQTGSTNINSSDSSHLSERHIGSHSGSISNKKSSSIPGGSTKSRTTKKHKYTPMEAKIVQKSIGKKGRKSIARKNNLKSGMTTADMQEDKDRVMLINNRKTKMTFEMKRHEDMKIIEQEKLDMERERLKMEKNTIMLKNNYERNRIVLLRLEMFKERQLIKSANPNVTDDYLNSHFPFPE